jgi:hypothetical protein
MAGYEIAYHRELASLVPAKPVPIVRSPAGSWMAASHTTPHAKSAPAPMSDHTNDAKVASRPMEGRPARQDKRRLSLAFFKGGAASEVLPERKAERAHGEPQSDAMSTPPSTRSRSRDNSKSGPRLSLSFLGPGSPAPDALPRFPTEPSSHSPRQAHRRSQSTDRRPPTSKSGKSEKSDHQRKGSVRKRLSMLNIGKKSSKSSVKGRVTGTLAEE